VSVTRSDDNPKLLISVILHEFEIQVARYNHDLRISESFESIRTNRCSVFFEEKRQIMADAPLEIIHISAFRQESHINSEYLSLTRNRVADEHPYAPLKIRKVLAPTREADKKGMRGQDEQQLDVFSYVSPEQRVPQDHPLRPLRIMTDEALRQLEPRFNKLYAKTGRPQPAKGLCGLMGKAASVRYAARGVISS
jgi:hypothetical protein